MGGWKTIAPLVALGFFSGQAVASDETMQGAFNAAGLFAALAFECEDDLADPALREFALSDGRETLIAGGYTAGDAEAKMGDIFAQLEKSWTSTGMPAAMCTTMLSNIKNGRQAFRLDLEQRR